MQGERFDDLRHLVELQRAARDEPLGDGTANGLAHRAGHQPRPRLAACHQARGDVHAVAQEIAVRLHHHVAQVNADADSRLAGFRERKRGFDGCEARAELEHEAVAGRVEDAAAVFRGDRFDNRAQCRDLGRRARLIGLGACRVPGDIEGHDGSEFAGGGVIGHCEVGAP